MWATDASSPTGSLLDGTARAEPASPQSRLAFAFSRMAGGNVLIDRPLNCLTAQQIGGFQSPHIQFDQFEVQPPLQGEIAIGNGIWLATRLNWTGLKVPPAMWLEFGAARSPVT